MAPPLFNLLEYLMAYKAQLVIRTNDPRDADVLDRIRALAEERGQTLSEIALEVLRQGLSPAPTPHQATLSDGIAPDTSTPSPAPPPASVPASAPASVPAAATKPSPVSATNRFKAAGTPRPTQVVVKKFLERYEQIPAEIGDKEPREEARKIIIDFFTDAGPAEVHALKKALKKVLRADDFEALMEPIKQTDVYQNYKRRVLLSL